MHLFSGGHDEVDFSTNGNKSYTRTDSYKKDVKTGQNIFNLSFDDSIIIFEDISGNDYNSIFDNQTLNWYRQLHRDYGVVISCYVYYEDGEFNLSQVPDKYKDEFVKNSNWLRFGFHTLNGETDYKKGKITNDYIKTINQLKRIVGKQSIDNVIRLQMFQGSYKEIKQLSQLVDEPVKGLLTADDKRQSYYLNKDNSKYI